jgi:CRP-like cAMP-binding protein
MNCQVEKKESEEKEAEKTEDDKEKLRDRLKNSLIFSALEVNDLESIINSMQEKKYSKDDTIVKQGDEAKEVFVIKEGFLSFTELLVNQSKPLGKR